MPTSVQLHAHAPTQYIFLILAIFALDLATGLLAIIFQEKLVANVRLRLINKLRSEYGVQASFTAAIDYVSDTKTWPRLLAFNNNQSI